MNTQTYFVRTCQECGHKQAVQPPNREKELSNSFLYTKCRKCKSESLDYGSDGWIKTATGFERPKE